MTYTDSTAEVVQTDDVALFDAREHQTGVRAIPRKMYIGNGKQTTSSRLPVCLGLYVGEDDCTSEVFGASQLQAAVRRARHVQGKLLWINTGAWCQDLWVQDLARPFGMTATRFYGRIPADVRR
jgi:hypothetical protein